MGGDGKWDGLALDGSSGERVGARVGMSVSAAADRPSAMVVAHRHEQDQQQQVSALRGPVAQVEIEAAAADCPRPEFRFFLPKIRFDSSQ